MTRVLFLTESFHPVLGGGEGHIRALGSALASAGEAPVVVTRRTDPSSAAEERLDGIRVVRVPPSGPGPRAKYSMVLPAMRAVAALRPAYDVLVVRGTRVLGLPGLVAGRAAGRPVVLQAELNGEMSGEALTWGKPWAGGPLGRGVRAAVRARNLLLEDADAFVAMSRLIAEEFRGAGVSPDRIALIPHGVDVSRFRPAGREEREALRARLRLPAAACVIAYSGRLLKGKGLPELVAAFARILPARDVHLLLLGSGGGQSLSVEGALREEVKAAGLESRVTFAGRVDAVADWLRAADIFAFPSVFEALGIALLEAAACGLPAVGSRTGGIVDVIEDGLSGRLVPPGDVEGLATALARLADHPEERAAQGRAAREIALRRFDAADAVARYRSLFTEVESRRRLGLRRWPEPRTAR